MGATIREVAREAGVSVATVSRVLNGSDKVRSSTRARVQAAARALSYVPNEAARSLIRSRTCTVGVLLPDLQGEFFAQVMRGIERSAQARGYHVLVSSSQSDVREAQTMIRTMHGRVDGLVVMWPRAEVGGLMEGVGDRCPLVLVGAATASGPAARVTVDNYGGARAMVAHLAEAHGHRRIAMLCGPEDNLDALDRRRGYRDALAAAGLPANEGLELPGDFRRETAYRTVDRLLEMDPRPTALFVANDAMAIGALGRLQERGLRVPEDMAVAGFDDVPTARYVTPALSTVHVPVQRLGERAVTALLDALGATEPNGEHEASTEPEVLPTELALRASCGCAPPG